jgi:hypothetical protein
MACIYPTGNCKSVLVGSAQGAHYLAVNASYLYWSDNNGITRAALAGGTQEVVYQTGPVEGLALDSTSVYFAADTNVYSIPLAGAPSGTATNLGKLVSGSSTPEALFVAVDGTAVYANSYTIGADEPITKFPLDGLPEGGTPITFAGTFAHVVYRIALDSSRVYWSNPTSVLTAPIDGGASVTLAAASGCVGSGPCVIPLASDATNIYTLDASNLVRISKATGMSGPIVAVPSQTVAAIAVDTTTLYWAENMSPVMTIRAIPLAGGSPVTLSSWEFGSFSIRDLVVDTMNIYWATDGQVWRLPK